MEETKNSMQKYLPWLMEVLALLVIFQSVVLVSSNALSVSSRQKPVRMKVGPFNPVPAPTIKVRNGMAAKLAFAPSSVSLKKGDLANVDLILAVGKDTRLDGMDIILTFDPKVLEITSVATPKLFSFVSQKKEKEKEGKVYVTFLEEKSNGLLVREKVKLLTLKIKGNSLGTSNVSIKSSEEGATTVIAESGTSRKIPFDWENLRVVVY